MSRLRTVALAATLAAATAGVGSAARAGVATTPAGADAVRSVDALWAEREAAFSYLGYTTHYSCDGLRDKVRWILGQVGARDKPRVTVSCTNLQGVEPMPRVHIRAWMPVEATPERVAEISAQQSSLKSETRAKAGAGPSSDEATAQFPATWERVSFVGQPTSTGQRIEIGDCELMEDMVRFVFGPLGVKVLPETSVSCVPRQLTLGSVNVQLEALRRVPEAQATR
jgi:hypothetical protein